MTDQDQPNEPVSPEEAAAAAAPADTPADGAAATPPAETAVSEEVPAEAAAAPADAEMETLRRERDDLYNRYLRSVADLDNYRRRVAREKEELRQYAVSGLVESLLPVLENLRLAVASARTAGNAPAVTEGVAMVVEQFRNALAAAGLAEINPEVGADFDPHQEESISHLPSETVPEGKILQVFRTGYALNGRIIRPASVVLSGGKPAPKGDDTP